MYDQFQYNTVTSNATTDANQGTPILTTGDKPRVILQLASYSGTNTAAPTISYVIVPATTLTINSVGQIDITGNETFNLGFGNADISGATETVPYVMGPYGVKGMAPQFAIVPPNCTLCAVPTINQNGTAIHTLITAEMC